MFETVDTRYIVSTCIRTATGWQEYEFIMPFIPTDEELDTLLYMIKDRLPVAELVGHTVSKRATHYSLVQKNQDK